MRRALLPALLFLLAVAGVALLGARIVATERATAERTAREMLRVRARAAAGVLQERAIAFLTAGQSCRYLARPDGTFVRPDEPAPFARLRWVRGRDAEGDFYLDEGERAEAVEGDFDRAAGLYRAAFSAERDPALRATALYRLAALERRRGDDAAAREAETAFAAALPKGSEGTLESLVVRARIGPGDAEFAREILRHVGSPDEGPALALLERSGLRRNESVEARREDLRTMERLRPFVAAAGDSPTGARVLGADLVAWRPWPNHRDPEFRLVDMVSGVVGLWVVGLPPLPTGVVVADAGAPLPGDALVETAIPGAPFVATRVVASMPLAEVEASAARRARLLVAALAALLLAGASAFVLTVRAARREAEAARARAAFVTRVGHDLRTPLAVIRMYAETLAAGKVADPAEAREFAGIAAREAERLTGMVGQALDLERVAEGDGALVPRPLDLAALAAEVAASHRPLLENAGLRLEVRGDGPLPVVGDSAALRGAVSNLLENAARHAASGGVVELETAHDGAFAALRILDRGPGIPEGMEESLFERFVRGPGARGSGAGLGLALVREAAEAHGGAAAASNREGGGAVFSVTLPLVREEGA